MATDKTGTGVCSRRCRAVPAYLLGPKSDMCLSESPTGPRSTIAASASRFQGRRHMRPRDPSVDLSSAQYGVRSLNKTGTTALAAVVEMNYVYLLAHAVEAESHS